MSDLKYQFTEHGNTHIVIQASAGTGKTYTIENIIPQFVNAGISLEKIAVLTFTEKAAAELQDRIRKQIYTQIKNSTDETKSKFETALETLPNANIGTIHHFCRFLLKKYSLELGFSAKFSEIRNASEDLEEYFQKFWWKIEKDDSKELIDLLQKVEYKTFKSILIGLTQKTGGKKIKLLEKVNPKSTESNFLKLKQLVDNCDYPKKNAGYHENLQTFLSQNFQNHLDKLNSLKSTFLTKENTPNKNVKKFILDNNSISEEDYEGLIHSLLNDFESIESIPILNSIFEYANLLIEDYDKLLLSQDRITLDGLILLTRKLILNPEIKKQIQSQVEYIILDECQDTNPIQIDLITKLFEGLEKGIIFVGDPKQSIYRFRDADLISYNQTLSKLNPKEFLNLDTSFRSSARLIDAFNFIFPKFEGIKEIYKDVKANRERTDSSEKIAPPLLLLGLDENNIPKSNDALGEDYTAETLRIDVLEEITQTIKTITDNPNYLIEDKNSESKFRNIQYSDIAILSGSNASLNRLLTEFSKRSISANIYKSNTFYTHKIVQAISHLLHAVENPNDSASLYKTLSSELFLIPEVTLYQLSQAGELTYLFDTKFPEINAIYESLRKAHENRYIQDVSYTLQEILVENQILEVISMGFEGKRNLANIYHLSEILSLNQLTENLSFGEVVRKLKKDVESSLEQEIKLDNDKKDQSFNSVQLMTMHASKGLEFPVCILYDLASKPRTDDTSIFLNDSSLLEDPVSVEIYLNTSSNKMQTPKFDEKYKQNEKELKREKYRLLYVAFTRAKDYLILPLHTLPEKKLSSNSLRSLIKEAFKNENIQELISKKLAENFPLQNNINKSQTNIPKKTEPDISKTPIRLSSLSNKDISQRAGIKIQSYSSIARHLEPEEESVKEKVAIEKNAKLEEENTAPITLSSEKRGTTFGLLCHAVMENFNLNNLSDPKKIEEEVKSLVNEYYPETNLNEITDYTSLDAITFCLTTLTKSYPMDENKTKFSKIQDWKYLKREKSFFYKLNSPKMDYLIGIGDGLFYWDNKYYLLDWKTNLIKPTESETIDEIIEKKVKESYYYQYMIYSMNLLDNITPPNQNKEEIWETKFGGMLFIFMRITEDKQGSYLIRPKYEEILQFKKDLEKLS